MSSSLLSPPSSSPSPSPSPPPPPPPSPSYSRLSSPSSSVLSNEKSALDRPFFIPPTSVPLKDPSEIAFVDETTWSTLTPHQKRAYMLELEQAQSVCRAHRTFTVRGNAWFLGGSVVGLAIAALSPNHWKTGKRMKPFLMLGLIGMGLDYISLTQLCERAFPIPSSTHTVEEFHSIRSAAEQNQTGKEPPQRIQVTRE